LRVTQWGEREGRSGDTLGNWRENAKPELNGGDLSQEKKMRPPSCYEKWPKEKD